MEQISENKLTIRQKNDIFVEQQLFQKKQLEAMKKNLPRYIRKRKKEFAEKFEKYVEDNQLAGQFFVEEGKIPFLPVIQHTFKPLIKVAGISPAYSADELSVTFDFYVDCCEKLNETGAYFPKIEDFCRLANISKSTFENYQNTNPDENMREVCNKIQDYCVARVADSSFASKDKAIVTYSIFHQKSSNKQRDNDPPQNNILVQNNNIMSDEQYNDFRDKFLNN